MREDARLLTAIVDEDPPRARHTLSSIVVSATYSTRYSSECWSAKWKHRKPCKIFLLQSGSAPIRATLPFNRALKLLPKVL